MTSDKKNSKRDYFQLHECLAAQDREHCPRCLLLRLFDDC